MTPQPPQAEPNFSQDLKAFEQQPAKTQALSLLKDQAEKSTGPESVVLNKKIQAQSTQPS
jgi:hypothetical protein